MRDGYCRFTTSTLMACVILSALLFCSGCSTTSEVTTYVSPVSGKRTDILAENLLDAPGENREMLWLNAYRDFLDQHRHKYYLEVIYGAREEKGHLDISPGRSLTIIADGDEMSFSSLGSLSKDEEKGALFEKAHYEVTSDDIYRLSQARNVTVRVRGKNGTIVRQFGPENFEKFRKFVTMTGADL
jgi:hypothetical protein